MMSLLFVDHILPTLASGDSTPINTTMLAEQWTGQDDWMELTVNDVPVGVMRLTGGTMGEGYASTAEVLLGASDILSGTMEMSALLNSHLELTQFVARLNFEDHGIPPLELAGMVEGKELLLRLKSPNGARFHSIDLRHPITLATASDPLMEGSSMRPGETYTVDVYDPLWGMQAGKLHMKVTGVDFIRIRGHAREAKRIESRLGNVVSKVWVDTRREEILQREIQLAPLNIENRSDSEDGEESKLVSLGPKLVMTTIDPIEAAHSFPELAATPDLPDLTPDEMRGEDYGEPLDGFGMLSLLLRGNLSDLKLWRAE
ncbi:hypothetical protein KQI84_14680 [bacterium]|nr:hypothetical protein [bacterium]